MVKKIQDIRYEEFKNDHYIDRLRQLCLIYTFLEPILGDKSKEIREIQMIIERLHDLKNENR